MPSKLFKLTLIAIILAFATFPDFADAKRGGGGRGRGRGSSGSSGTGRGSRSGGFRTPTYKGAFYQGVVIIPVGDGTYREGWGTDCPNGCAINGMCGTPEQCASTFNWYSVMVIGIVVAAVVFLCCFFKKKLSGGMDNY